jgi:hypothetical protein
MLLYADDNPRYAAYYPLAEFSPELQAIRWAGLRGISPICIDLPAAYSVGVRVVNDRRHDALDLIAEATGFEDVEDWWEHSVEHRSDSTSLFEGLEELMAALREGASVESDPSDDDSETEDPRPTILASEYQELRESWMRQCINKAAGNGERVAVVCGAWHLPALKAGSETKPSNLSKCKVSGTIVPWTYDRMTRFSGYGAGAKSPAFYEMLWTLPAEELTRRWLISVARLMRDEDLDASSASVIEAVRLADALAALRNRPRPGLRELCEAANSVLIRDSVIWDLIGRRLIVGERLGEVSERVPAVPLQQDLVRLQKKLRLPVDDTDRLLELDLRGETDLSRSHLLFRLQLLGIEWGRLTPTSGKRGTFHEHWNIQWTPPLAISVIEASLWGNSVESAATAFATSELDGIQLLAPLAKLVENILLSDLSGAIDPAVQRLQDVSATAADVADLADALPPLVSMQRYGTVRKVDTSHISPVVDAVFTRCCLGLPGACLQLDDEAAAAMARRLSSTAAVARLLEEEEKRTLWADTLRQVAELAGVNPLLAGKAERLRFDFGVVNSDHLARRLQLEASQGSTAIHMAAFVEGLLEGPGTILIHQDDLWQAVKDWVDSLTPDVFDDVLPLIRRTFALFTKPERRQLGERLSGGPRHRSTSLDFDEERGKSVLPVIRMILGVGE